VTEINQLDINAMEMLELTSRTFFIPISYLAPSLKEAVAAAYLCMRAIDEIEDHPELPSQIKYELLKSVSQIILKPDYEIQLSKLFEPYSEVLPAVTIRLSEWINYCPSTIVEKVLESTSIMSIGMAKWVLKDWQIKTEADLDDYTYYVAGLVGVMLTDIWKWYDSTDADRDLAVAYGRGLQSVNILRNQLEDSTRGVNFFPDGWNLDDMFEYARRNLNMANEYVKQIKSETILLFCQIPLALAIGTLEALTEGKDKMSRDEVNALVNLVLGK
jgi:farnesyl-diphosphate farnesyltransferase